AHQTYTKPEMFQCAHELISPEREFETLTKGQCTLHWEALHQLHAFGKRLLEIQFPLHGSGGNFCYLFLDAHQSSELVDELALDEGGIHVHAHQTLVAPEDIIALHGDIDTEVHALAEQFTPEVAE